MGARQPGRTRRANTVAPLQTLSTFFIAVLRKKYTNPSSDIIAVLAGLDNVDTVFTDFVGSLEYIIRNGRNCQWISCLQGPALRSNFADGTMNSGSAAEGCRSCARRDIRRVPDQLAHLFYPERPVPGRHEGRAVPSWKS